MGDASDVNEGGFWIDRVPCWIMRACSREARRQCSAYIDQSRPCWEHDDTLTKRLLSMDTCFTCEVFHRYGPRKSVPHPTREEDGG